MLQKPLTYIFPHVPDDIDISALDCEKIPAHVAVIMDGNGRWAKKRALQRLLGHRAGIEAVRELIRCANDIGVHYLTIYSFSSENWRRPADEVSGLMNLFATTMLKEVDELHKENVRIMTIGNMGVLPAQTRIAFEEAYEKTCQNTGMTLVVAINYGARSELVRATQQLVDQHIQRALSQGAAGGASDVLSGAASGSPSIATLGSSSACELGSLSGVPSDTVKITEDDIEQHLYTRGLPDPDLIIRTSGELRLSNFLLWQAAYAELISSSVLWPDFDRYEFLRCLLEFQKRDRRFGAV